MSLWWANREQLDPNQVDLIENLPLDGDHLVVGPPGSGKTNVLLRRAQFVRLQSRPNVLVLTFTRALTEFVKTGCYTPEGREIFPPVLINTLEGWIRGLYKMHGAPMPDAQDQDERRAAVAVGATGFASAGQIPKYDGLFIDEAQDLLEEELYLLRQFSNNLFFVGDDRQKIYGAAAGLVRVRNLQPTPSEHSLPFHYRLAREICQMADRIMVPTGVASLASTQHYVGPTPGRVSVEGPLTRDQQIAKVVDKLRDQIRVYGDLLGQGDRLGVIVPRKDDRAVLFDALERDPALAGKSKVMRARDGSTADRRLDTSIDGRTPILILTAQGAKGLEFRAVQWLFSDDLESYYTPEVYYTIVTRAKTSLDIYYTARMPIQIAKAYSPPSNGGIW